MKWIKMRLNGDGLLCCLMRRWLICRIRMRLKKIIRNPFFPLVIFIMIIFMTRMEHMSLVGYVKAGPLLSVGLSDGYDDEDNKTGYYVCIDEWYEAPTILDAFADYVAYIMYASPEEKAEIRSMNTKIEENEQLVKDYCKQYLNWDIPELGK